MKKSNKIIIIVIALVVSFAVFIAQSYYTIAVLKKVTLNYNQLMTVLRTNEKEETNAEELPENSTSKEDATTESEIEDDNIPTIDIEGEIGEGVFGKYSEEKHKMLMKEYDSLLVKLTYEDKMKIGELAEKILVYYPDYAPKEKYNPVKCATDKWYLTVSMDFVVRFYSGSDADFPGTFDERYALSSSKKGQYELVSDFCNLCYEVNH